MKENFLLFQMHFSVCEKVFFEGSYSVFCVLKSYFFHMIFMPAKSTQERGHNSAVVFLRAAVSAKSPQRRVTLQAFVERDLHYQLEFLS